MNVERPDFERCPGGAATLAAAAVAVAAVLRCLRSTGKLTRQVRQLEQVSRSDPLTELPNRRYLEEQLRAAASAARRHHSPLSVLFIDVDSFKRVNDELGHHTGDGVLREVTQRIRATLRAEDILGRWGGEEFVAVLPATALDGALAVGERVRASAAAHPIAVDGRAVSVTLSVGCAPWSGTTECTVRAAGDALGQAKRNGKNCVVSVDH